MHTSDQAAVRLCGCRALVTGGVGFIGSHIVLGYEPTIGLADGLRQLVSWWQEEQCAKTR